MTQAKDKKPAGKTQKKLDAELLAACGIPGSAGAISDLLAAVAYPDALNNDGFTPLHLAAMSAADQCLIALIAAGAELDARDSQGRLPEEIP